MSNIGQIINYNGYQFRSDIGMMTPTQYIKMICMLEELSPRRICEFGSGESTRIFDNYIKKNNAVRYSIEHDEIYNYHNHTIMLPLKFLSNFYSYSNCMIYDGFEQWLNNEQPFEFILIDGPNDGIPVNDKGLLYCRIQLLDFVLMNKISNNCTVMYHDSERDIAQNTLNEFEALLDEKNYLFNKEIVKEMNKEYVTYNEAILGRCPELTIYNIYKY